ncbi:MAG: hypothetical protein A2Z31_10280 [candidate division NC10 bacterium RBG_16_65_8]|nr:MAG: hypothetical protein A2Z31_10280 [candidate division NC10 bacterium RBG_16_65_8]
MLRFHLLVPCLHLRATNLALGLSAANFGLAGSLACPGFGLALLSRLLLRLMYGAAYRGSDLGAALSRLTLRLVGSL